MDDLSKYRDLIDAYLLDQLNASEQEAFENALQRDARLREEVEDSRILMEGIEAAGRAGLKKRLGSLENRLPARKKASNPFLRWSVGIAAAVLLMLIPGYFIVQAYSGVNSEAVFSDHFNPYPVLENGPVRGAEDETLLGEGLRAYQLKNYREAIAVLERHGRQTEDAATADFYLAISHLALGEASQAVPLLQDLSEDEGFLMREQAALYFGLALVKNEQPDEARVALRSLSETAQDVAIKQRALDILDDL